MKPILRGGGIVRKAELSGNGDDGPEAVLRLDDMDRLMAKAIGLFEGNRDAAWEWMNSPIAALGGAKPFDAACSIRASDGENMPTPTVARVEALIAEIAWYKAEAIK